MTRPFYLTTSERHDLEEMRDHAPKPYLRERASALLKVDDGIPAARVAREGLLRPRKPDTVYAWIDRFIEHGLSGLLIRSGRGRKPAFSPSPLELHSRASHSEAPLPRPTLPTHL